MSDSSVLTPTCPQCGAALPSAATEGLCPKCLLAQALQMPSAEAPDPDVAVTIPLSRPRPKFGGNDSMDLPLPEELSALLPAGAYKVEDFIGQGGMGAVYKGTQIRLKRPVAIKIMRRDQGRDYDFEVRFEHEAQAMAKLNHPNIVGVHDYGEAGPDYLYLVMELVEGADMMDVIRTGRMTQEMALTLLPQICDALQFAHDRGIIHRDIKPSNIMLTRDGHIKIADFGLAKRLDPDSNFRTQTGTGMGSPDYAAPEQLMAGAEIDHRADIYALGVMIYQMITGQLPRGVWQPPSQRAPVDMQWDEIVHHAMQNDPKDRYQQASEVKTDVSKITPKPSEGSSERSAAERGGGQAASNTPVRPPSTGGAAAKKIEAGKSARAPFASRAPLIFAIITVLALGAFFAFRNLQKWSAQSSVRSGSNDPTASAPSPAPLTPKQSIDLLALVDVKRDKLKADSSTPMGEWTSNGGLLSFAGTDSRRGKIGAPVALETLRDYEIEVIQPRLQASPVGLDCPITAGSQATVSFVPGVHIELRADDTNKPRKLADWPKEVATPPWKIAVRVKRGKDDAGGTITATINGMPAGEWHGNLTRLGKTPEPHPEFAGHLVPALFAPSGDCAYSAWTLRVFEGEAQLLRAPSTLATHTSPHWTDALTAWWAEPQNQASGAMVKEPNGSRIVDDSKSVGLFKGNNATDREIRATLRFTTDPNAKATINLRTTGSAADGFSRYFATLSASGTTTMGKHVRDKPTLLNIAKLPASFAPGDRHTFLFRAVGNTLTLMVDDLPVTTVSDSDHKAGWSHLLASAGIVIEKLEYRDLPAAAAKQTLDLITLVDVQRDRLKAEGNAGTNEWTKNGGQLSFVSDDKRSGKISAPIALNGLRDYEVEVGVPNAPESAIGLDFPLSATNQATIDFVPGEVVVFRNANQKLQEIGKWPKDAIGPPWKLAARMKLDADGMNVTLSATVNGLPVGEWRGALGWLVRRSKAHPDFPGQFVPALYVPAGKITHSSWTLRVFEGEAKVLRTPSTNTFGPWQPFLSEADWKLTTPGRREVVDGRLRLQASSVAKPQPAANGAIRARLQFREETKAAALQARMAPDNSKYKLQIKQSVAALQYVTGGAETIVDLGQYLLPKPLQPGDTMQFELRLQGDRLTALVNGVVAIEARDSRLPGPGDWGITATAGWFESVEVQTPTPATNTITATKDAPSQGSAGTPARPSTLGDEDAKSNFSPWQPLLTDEEWKQTTSGKREFVDGRLHLLGPPTVLKPQRTADGAIRARLWQQEEANTAGLLARMTTAGAYKVEVRSNSVQLRYFPASGDFKTSELLGEHTLPQPLKPGATVLVEFRLQGDRLTTLVDGATVIEARDSRISGPGQWGIMSINGWFESAEVQTPAP